MESKKYDIKAELPIEAIYDKIYADPVASRINRQTVMGVIEYDKQS